MKRKEQPMTKSQAMSRIKNKDTSIELILRKALWKQGFRYRKNCKDIFGKPDICFKLKKIAIFCDSEFWHGKKFLEGEKFKTNTEFWENKILKNIKRDREVTSKLESEGWIVLRFWGQKIKQDLNSCLNEIIKAYNNKE
ncbi:very short patch repair endonuclease [Sulfurimonas sp.]